jgi:hypothetical protein
MPVSSWQDFPTRAVTYVTGTGGDFLYLASSPIPILETGLTSQPVLPRHLTLVTLHCWREVNLWRSNTRNPMLLLLLFGLLLLRSATRAFLCRVRTVRLSMLPCQVSLNSPPNRTCSFHCIRLSNFLLAISLGGSFPACNALWHWRHITIVFL